MFSRTETRRRKHAWNNRHSLDRSLVAWIFRVSRNCRFYPRRSYCGLGTARASFYERQRSKRLKRCPTPASLNLKRYEGALRRRNTPFRALRNGRGDQTRQTSCRTNRRRGSVLYGSFLCQYQDNHHVVCSKTSRGTY